MLLLLLLLLLTSPGLRFDVPSFFPGMLYGRTQLIKLSPKKTVEGFVGAAFTTVLFGYLVSGLSDQPDFIARAFCRVVLIQRTVVNIQLQTVGYHLHALPVHGLPRYRSREQRFLRRDLLAQRCLHLAIIPSLRRGQHRPIDAGEF